MDLNTPSSFSQLLTRYMDRFGDSPPVFGLPEPLAVEVLGLALKEDRPTPPPPYIA